MSKLDRILASSGSNIDASMGAGREARPLHGASPSPAGPGSARLAGVARSKDAAEIPVDRITNDPGQPREEFAPDALARLAESLKTRGQLQPIRVRWDEQGGHYVIVMGERRWRAAKLAGIPSLTCIVMDAPPDPGDLLAIQLVENALREDLSPMEQARAYRQLIDLRGWSARQLAAELAVNPATVTRALALLDLPAAVQESVEQGALAPSAAYEISKLEGDDARAEVAAAVIDQKMTRGEVAQVVAAVKARRPAPEARPDPVVIDLGDGCTITIRYRRAGGPSPLTALRRATKALQEQDRVLQDRDASSAA